MYSVFYTSQIQLKVLFHRPDFSPDELLNSIGIMLHIFVAGWEDTECEKVLAFTQIHSQSGINYLFSLLDLRLPLREI